ncbi:hypothetical protein ASD62_14135 [Phycicoccus sp. Root563]|nr:hypothetical protein [Phycicoccus sp. Root563]KQZ90261.1 hypothetical protein ASD62_14135 [Phycicoccus sp. Root563]
MSVVPNGSESEEYDDSNSPVAASTRVEEPVRWIGLVHDPTRATAADQSSKSGDSNRFTT